MNLSLLDPFEQQWPDSVTESFFVPRLSPSCCSFNKRGNYLALGGNEGQVAVWDLEATRSASRVLSPMHGGKVNSVSWSNDGEWLLSASVDHKITIWDLFTGKRFRTFHFPAPVTLAHFHPRRRNTILVCVATFLPCIIRFDGADGPARTYPIWLEAEGLLGGPSSSENSLEGLAQPPAVPATRAPENEIFPENDSGYVDYLTDEQSAAEMGVYVGCFSHRGDQVYLGSPRGILTVADTWTRAVTFQTRIVEAQMKVPVKQVAVSRRGNFILFNTNDKSIRAMPIDATTGHPMPYLTVRYRDNVQGYQWAACCFSPDEDFVVAGSQVKGSHELYVWDRLTGNLKRKLEGPAEGGSLRDLAWHPHRPIIAAVSQEDRVYIWANSTEENWSAFAPDFREIEENTDYREMEDEFDIVEDDGTKIHGYVEAAEELPDVTTIPPVIVFDDSGSEFDEPVPASKRGSDEGTGARRKRRRVVTQKLFDLPPLNDMASEQEESEEER